MELSTVPMFQGEIVPAPVRGFAVATCRSAPHAFLTALNLQVSMHRASDQFSIIAGGIVINAICRGTSELTTNK